MILWFCEHCNSEPWIGSTGPWSRGVGSAWSRGGGGSGCAGSGGGLAALGPEGLAVLDPGGLAALGPGPKGMVVLDWVPGGLMAGPKPLTLSKSVQDYKTIKNPAHRY